MRVLYIDNIITTRVPFTIALFPVAHLSEPVRVSTVYSRKVVVAALSRGSTDGRGAPQIRIGAPIGDYNTLYQLVCMLGWFVGNGMLCRGERGSAPYRYCDKMNLVSH